jgi:hypothetical protein
MTKQQEFNRIKIIIENPKNKLEHLEGINNIVLAFVLKNDSCNLTSLLIKKYEELESKFK